MSLAGDKKVVAFSLDLHTEPAEGVWDDAEVADRDILDEDAVATHGSHTYKGAYLDHVGEELVLCAMQLVHALYRQQVRGDATDLGPHPVQQFAQLLQIWFAGCVVNSSGAFGKDGRHDDIGRSRHRGLVE